MLFIPLRRDDEKRQAPALATYLIILANIIGFVLSSLPHDFTNPADDFARTLSTYGFVPAEPTIIGLLASMFLHANILHLAGNMLFLFAVGPSVEEAFGPIGMTGFYLMGGCVATGVFKLFHWDSTKPLIGASGAIAAVMGVYLVRYWRKKMRFLIFPWFRIVSAAAQVVLPLWFAEQLLVAYFELGGNGTGVAGTAHLGGFTFGLVAALTIGVMPEREKRSYKELVKVSDTIDHALADNLYQEAIAAELRGDIAGARKIARELLLVRPDAEHALQLAVDLAVTADDDSGIDAPAARLLNLFISNGRVKDANALVAQLAGEESVRVLPRFLARAAAWCDKRNEHAKAARLYRRLAEIRPFGKEGVESLVNAGVSLQRAGDAAAARAAFEAAHTHAGCTPEWATVIRDKVALLEG
ncbi:MAG TPA: rhomboid family intramembrane serine protease [Thermoanaerobaculia bacterium]|nr:rhomboid family intramembrane serine protease [Thermoanaerobaculia bacterium]